MSFDPEAHPRITVSPTGCWLYDGLPTGKGHMKLAAGASTVVAHAVFYAVLVGPIQRGQLLHHECEQKACVNPAHLTPLWPREHASEHYVAPTACPQGHPYPESSFRGKDGLLRCRPCARERNRAYKQRLREQRGKAA